MTHAAMREHETYDPPAFARFLDDDIAFFEKVGRAVAIEKQ